MYRMHTSIGMYIILKRNNVLNVNFNSIYMNKHTA